MPTGQQPSPAYHREQAMPYGTVQRANAGTPAATQRRPASQTASQTAPQPGATPEEQFLFGPTNRPTEPLTAGAPFGPGPGGPMDSDVPANIRLAMPTLQRLASEPDAPEQLRTIVSYLLHRAT